MNSDRGIRYAVYTRYDQQSNPWGLTGITLNVMAQSDGYRVKVSESLGHMVYIIVKPDNMPLFTINVHNRLLAVFRRYYSHIVLIEYVTPELVQLEREAAEQSFAKRELKRLEKEAQEMEKIKADALAFKALLDEHELKQATGYDV